MSSTSVSVSVHGSNTALAPESPGGMPPGAEFCQSCQTRSQLAWCIQNTGSAGAPAMVHAVPRKEALQVRWVVAVHVVATVGMDLDQCTEGAGVSM